MRLSPAMQATLLFIKLIEDGKTAQCGRPTYHGNLVTHNALIRRGLTEEADDTFHTTTLTEKGRAEAIKLREAGKAAPPERRTAIRF